MKSMIRDIKLAPSGHKKIEWVMKNMPVLSLLEKEFADTKPLKGIKLSVAVHLEAKTAYFSMMLAAGGADVAVTGCNPLSTQDDVAAALVENGLNVYAWHNPTDEEYHSHIEAALSHGPNIIVDDGGDMVSALHTKLTHLLPGVYGGCEETKTGINRLMAMASENVLKFPMIAVNDAYCKHLFDNRYGTGQSVWDGINRTTNLIVAGKRVVVAGYGWCGKGIAMRAKGQGAHVTVTEVDPVRALEALMDGYEVTTMDEAVEKGDLFITVSGCEALINGSHFNKMKNGAILCNAGHFDCEIEIRALDEMAVSKQEMKTNIVGYNMKDGRQLYVLGSGRLVNLACGDGHPAEIMDMSFAVQALSVKYLAENHKKLSPGVISVPYEIDERVARTKLAACGAKIDNLTEEQKKYMNSWA